MNLTPVEGVIRAQRYKPFTVMLELPRRQGDELANVAARTSIEQQVISVTLLNGTDNATAQYAVSMPRSLFAAVTGLLLHAKTEHAASELIYMILRDRMALGNVPPLSDTDAEDEPF